MSRDSSRAVHVIGASGRSGAALCQTLAAEGRTFVPVVRDRSKWAATGLAGDVRVADLLDAASMASALADATTIVSCAHARHIPSILQAAPADASFVFLGSTRKFTRWPDAHGNGVLAGEAALSASGRPGALLHPTMIYGAQGEDNVQRLAALMRRLPILPLPRGGRSLVQPIHQDDVTRAIIAALDRDWQAPLSLVIAGPSPITYRDFCIAVAAAAGLRRPRIVSMPVTPLLAAAFVTRLVSPAAIRRLLEDKAFDIAPMRAALGFTPRSFTEGLARTFANRQGSGP